MKKGILIILFTILLASCISQPSSDFTPPPEASDTPQSQIPTSTDPLDLSEEAAQPPEPGLLPTIETPPILSNWQVEYEQIYFEDFETLQMESGFTFGEYGNSNITTELNEVISGNASLSLSEFGFIQTNPDELHLDGNATYLVEVDYQILSIDDPNDEPLFVWLQPEDGSHENISTFPLLGSADPQGSYVAGALTSDAQSYILSMGVSGSAIVVIDNIRVIRQSAHSRTDYPEQKLDISSIPYPRLGNYMLGTILGISGGIGGEPPGTYSVNQLVDKFSMYDVIIGADIRIQTFDPGFVYQLRKKNPNLILIPYLSYDGQNMGPDSQHMFGGDGTIDIYHNFAEGLSDQWVMKDTQGFPQEIRDWGGCCFLNISEYSPRVNGQTYNEYLIDWIGNTILPSGEWDGIFFDNLFGRISFYINNNTDPSAFDYDYNLNGVRDETPADVSEMYRTSTVQVLENIREEMDGLGIIMGNTGANPETFLAPYVNGYSFECVDEAWFAEWHTSPSEAGWRKVLDDYFTMEKYSMAPIINIFEGCGRVGAFIEPDHIYLNPTDEDIQAHRFTLGTALLGNGFYEYDLFDARSAPYWFDEFAVDPSGVAVNDPQYKGYLGLALGNAIELKSPATVIWEEDFESCEMTLNVADPRIYVSQQAEDTLNGSCSLVIDNPDHTKQAEIFAQIDPRQLPLNSGETYLVEFDWKILETIDGDAEVSLWVGDEEFSTYGVPGDVKGDGGKANFPFTIESGNVFSLRFLLGSGGGKVAFDDIKITPGGVGPWRRDFENGIVLVNPINKSYTFSPEELAGPLNRTGIKRILGTQAPDVNNGQFVAGSLTLEPFDAIILLADTILVE